jgi:hypothetical protein
MLGKKPLWERISPSLNTRNRGVDRSHIQEPHSRPTPHDPSKPYRADVGPEELDSRVGGCTGCPIGQDQQLNREVELRPD